MQHRQKNMQLKTENAKLEEENVELVETTNKQSRKLYAVSDICKNTYASVVLANPAMIKVISRSLCDSLKTEYPQLSNMDYTYMFLDFIELSVKDICQMLNVQEGTYYCRRSAIKKKLGTEFDQDIDDLFNTEKTSLKNDVFITCLKQLCFLKFVPPPRFAICLVLNIFTNYLTF